MHRTTAEGNVDNKYSAGNPAEGIKATRITAKSMNSIQEELCNTVEDAGLTLDDENDNQLTAAIRLLNVALPSGSLAPRAQLTPNNTIQVLGGFIFDGSTITTVAAQNTGAIAAPVSNPRIDRVVADNVTGTISVVTGVEASTPSAPNVPAGALPVAQIALAVGQTTIIDQNIKDERSFNVMLKSFTPGDIKVRATATVETGWLACDGSAVSRTTYAALFAAIGTAWGSGNGTTTFNIPDFRGRTLIGKDDMGGTSANRITNTYAGFDGDVLGSVGGDERIGTHLHPVTDTHRHWLVHAMAGGEATASGPTFNVAGNTDAIADISNGFSGSFQSYYQLTSRQTPSAGSVADTALSSVTAQGSIAVNNNSNGGSSANVQPSAVAMFVIKT